MVIHPYSFPTCSPWPGCTFPDFAAGFKEKGDIFLFSL